MVRCIAWLAAAILMVGVFGASAQAQSFAGLGFFPGGDQSFALGVSDDGRVVVGSAASAGGSQAFRWTVADGMTGLGSLAGANAFSSATAISGDGQVIVGSSANTTGATEAFRWTAGEGIVGVADEAAKSLDSGALGVSFDGGVIVGETWDAGGRKQAFRWTASEGMIALGVLPDANGGESGASDVSADGAVVIGTSDAAVGSHAFRWTAADGMTSLGVFDGQQDSSASAISDSGAVIVGGGETSDGADAFRWIAGEGLQSIGHLPTVNDPFASAAGVSADGSVVVGVSNGSAFLWQAGVGMRHMKDVLTNDFGLDLTDWRLTFATDVSADGRTIIGGGFNPDGQSEAWIATVPEPASGLLIGLGLVGAVAALYRARQRQ